jgi:para-aminobenzoate synthetase/4-amino-4-deoxychorismate lyase
VRVEAVDLPPVPARVRLGLAPRPVDSASVFLFHKTTRRELYDEALLSRPDCDDVLLSNERGELTESAIANVAIPGADGVLDSPPVECGLLPGVEREALLAEGRLREKPLLVSGLAGGQRVVLMNSVRGLYDAVFIG